MPRVPIVIVHGGAGVWPRKLHSRALRGVGRAAEVGQEILGEEGSAIDAVEAAVVELENDPLFNAGTGSALNLLGQTECDAAIMDGKSLHGAGVALLRDIKNPVKAARIVMEKTDHVLLAGSAARKLAIASKLQVADLKTIGRARTWRAGIQSLRHGKSGFSRIHRDTTFNLYLSLADTVGSLAIDSKGNAAAADSTGGIQLKIPGRIGDSAILGAGIYADSTSAAAATGSGEQAIRLAITKTACDLMKEKSAASAAVETIKRSTRLFGKGMGLVTLKRDGSYGIAHNTPNLCWAVKSVSLGKSGMLGIRVFIK